MATLSNPGFHPPQQSRSHETHARILQATRELLEDASFEELTVQQIATRAGCSVGAFYGRFRDKEALLPCLLDLHYAEIEAEVTSKFVLEARVGGTLEQRVGSVIDHLVSVARREPGLIRTLVQRNHRHPDSIPAPIHVAARSMLARVYSFLLEARAEILHPAPRTALEVGLLMVIAAIRERLVWVGATQAASLSVPRETFVDELKCALLTYLTMPRK